jgi:hypothetical protein
MLGTTIQKAQRGTALTKASKLERLLKKKQQEKKRRIYSPFKSQEFKTSLESSREKIIAHQPRDIHFDLLSFACSQ